MQNIENCDKIKSNQNSIIAKGAGNNKKSKILIEFEKEVRLLKLHIGIWGGVIAALLIAVILVQSKNHEDKILNKFFTAADGL